MNFLWLFPRLKCFFLCLLLSSSSFSQNSGIHLLKKINVSRNRSLDPTFKFITNSTVVMDIATPLTILTWGLITKDSVMKRNAFVMSAALLTSSIITSSLKYGIDRPRPFVTYPFIEQETSAGPYSFPSGHTSGIFSLATSVSLAYQKWYVIAPSYLVASSVAYSRMFLGVHYPGDVMAGAVIGIGSSYLCYVLNKRLLKKHPLK